MVARLSGESLKLRGNNGLSGSRGSVISCHDAHTTIRAIDSRWATCLDRQSKVALELSSVEYGHKVCDAMREEMAAQGRASPVSACLSGNGSPKGLRGRSAKAHTTETS